MKAVSAYLETEDPDQMISGIWADLAVQLGGVRPELLICFITAPLARHAAVITQALVGELAPVHHVVCTAESVAGIGAEIELKPALSALALCMPDAAVRPFHIDEEDWDAVLEGDRLGELMGPSDQVQGLMILSDPFSAPIVQLLQKLDRDYPEVPVFGGMASGVNRPGQVALICDGKVAHRGAIGVAFTGAIEIDTVVSQGCRPIGTPMQITRCQSNVIEELGGVPAIQAIEAMITGLSLQDRVLMQSKGLFIGAAVDARHQTLGPGDFLIRSLVSVKAETGAVAIGDYVHQGQTIQFHLRDADAADAEMRLLLEGEVLLSGVPEAVLMFTCNGRGQRLFNLPHHDAALVQSQVGKIPLAGFFAAGEIGPVGGRNFVHGQTAALALLRSR